MAGSILIGYDGIEFMKYYFISYLLKFLIMNSVKKVFYTIMAGVVVGATLGVLFAPEEGAETRRKLKKLKKKFTRAKDDGDTETLEELRSTLQTELNMVNEKLNQ